MTKLNLSQITGTLAGLASLSSNEILTEETLQTKLEDCIESLESHTKAVISLKCDLLTHKDKDRLSKLDGLL